MASINIPLVGQSYQSRSVPLSAQVTRNLYPEPVAAGLSPSALLCWPGAKAFSIGGATNRGMYNKEWLGYVWTVEGTSLKKTNSAGTKTKVGTIAGAGRCVFAGASFYLYIVTGGLVYRTDGTTVSQVTDADLEAPNSAAFLNSQLIYDGDAGRFCVSDAGDGSSIDGLNYATAESSADDLTRVYTFQESLILFGTDSIEQWYNSGVGNPPFDRFQGSLRAVGIAGVHCATNTDKAVYFLGSDRTIYRLEGYEPVQVSTIAINNAIESYATVSDCFAFALKLQGQSVVVFSFPTASKTWAYSESFAMWFELSSGVSGGRHIANGYCYAFGKHLIADYRSGNIYQWDLATFTDYGAEIVRERVTQPLYSELLGPAGKIIFWSRLELIINSGNGLATGQGSAPQVMMSYSDDMGLTWSNEVWTSAGALGAYQWRVEWYSLGAAIGRIYKFRLTDPIEFNLFRLTADVEIGI